MVIIKEFIDSKGKSHFASWFDNLDVQAAVKITAALSRIENGNFSNVKSVGSGVYEYVINYGPGYRIYFGKDRKNLVILLGGGSKKKQQNDIDKAKTLWKAYKKEKKKGRKSCR